MRWQFPFKFHFKFNPSVWKTHPGLRRFFARDLIRSRQCIGLSKYELITLLGLGRNGDYWYIVSYDIPSYFFSRYKKKLDFYIEDDIVVNGVLKYRRK